jgi:predicted dehydrogenase
LQHQENYLKSFLYLWPVQQEPRARLTIALKSFTIKILNLSGMQTINWGIIGCGDVTEVKSGPAFGKIANSQLVAVMRRDGQKARDYAIRHNVPHWYNNAADLINNPLVNAIYVATPPGSHAEYAIMAMNAGKPVYVEKPMATSYTECQQMISVSEETGVPLFVAYYRRMLPGFVKIKELLDSDAIGKPLFFQVRYFMPPQAGDFSAPLPWRVVPEISGGGYVYDLGSHQLDLIDHLLGPIERVSSLTANQLNLYTPEDYISAGFTGHNGIMGNAVWNFGAPPHSAEDTMEIIGEKGKIVFSCFGFTDTKLIVNGTTTLIENPRPEHVQKPLIETIVDQLLGKPGTQGCPSNGITAGRTSRILDLITGKIK